MQYSTVTLYSATVEAGMVLRLLEQAPLYWGGMFHEEYIQQ